MHTFFNTDLDINHSVTSPPDWSYTKEGLSRNLQDFKTFYRTNPMAVKSNHFLVRLLQSITISQTLPVNRYYDYVSSMALNLSMALGMTSSIAQGRVFRGTFFGLGSEEILIATDTVFDPVYANSNWRNLSPVTFLRHPSTGLNLDIADGKTFNSQAGLSILEINIPLLAVQYRAFRHYEIDLIQDREDSQKSIMQFIHMFVLPNMMDSYLDYAIFNRTDYMSQYRPMIDRKVVRPFFQPDYTGRVDKILKQLVGRFLSTNLRFDAILDSIPSVQYTSARQSLRLPLVAPSRQIVWALTLSRLPALAFLFRVNNHSGSLVNQSYINQIIRAAMYYKNDRTIKSVAPLNIYLDAQETISYLTSGRY